MKARTRAEERNDQNIPINGTPINYVSLKTEWRKNQTSLSVFFCLAR